jgi:hypothetical protein
VQILAYRRMDCGLGEALLLYMKWVPFFVVFFGGMSYHISTALLAHLFGYNSKFWFTDMQPISRCFSIKYVLVVVIWQGTIKEVEVSYVKAFANDRPSRLPTWPHLMVELHCSNFFKELPQTLKNFWLLYVLCILLLAGMIVMSLDFIPKGYRILSFIDIVPLAITVGSHLLLPMVLNRTSLHVDYNRNQGYPADPDSHRAVYSLVDEIP